MIMVFLSLLTQAHPGFTQSSDKRIALGKQPHMALDTKGILRIVFGRNDSIFCIASTDQGQTFTDPMIVGRVKDMHLGMSRGPQIASSAHVTLITATDKAGNIHAFRLDHATEQWKKMGQINDQPASAPEGLMSVAADQEDHFYAVWLDVRSDHKNKIYVASSQNQAEAWLENVLAYQSPDSTVCECCQPAIAVSKDKVYLMFRNWLNGSRDMYVMQSGKDDLSFTSAQKLGEGTWKLNGCPMDGGGIFIDDQQQVHTTWQREGKIYYSQPGQKEVLLGTGRGSSISGGAQPVIAWQEGTMLKARFLDSGQELMVGEGSFVEVRRLTNKKTVLVWENDGSIQFRKI